MDHVIYVNCVTKGQFLQRNYREILCGHFLTICFVKFYGKVGATTWLYSKTCLKGPHKKKTKIGFQDRLSLNAGQKYCRMLQGEHSAILSTFIKLPFVIKIFVLSIFEWLLKTGFTVYPNLYYQGVLQRDCTGFLCYLLLELEAVLFFFSGSLLGLSVAVLSLSTLSVLFFFSGCRSLLLLPG